MKLTHVELEGKKRPERGPYPKGVVNGPDPTTLRGIRRRKAAMKGYQPLTKEDDDTSPN